MPLSAGTRLGSYEVIAAIGAGGMGEVYRARDTRLDRDVALKILPESFAADPDRRARFEREAKALAALNHPNIAQVYGFDVAGDVHAIAMELVEGGTLADLIAAGPMPLADVLPIARQLAAALDAAHEQGIVHRDLKPANVIVRDDGTVKVLDFGLAKALAGDIDGSATSIANSPTLTARATQLGVVLGTAAYMSPEQARGKAVDRRADIWAFGAVLYEMLTGRRAFEGDDISDVLASVLKTEPDWSALPADLPSAMRRLLRRCLEKDARKRLRDLSEGMLQLDEELSGAISSATAIRAGDAAASAAAVQAPSRPLWRRALHGAALVIVAAAIGAVGWLRPVPESPRERIAFTHTPDPGATLFTTQAAADLAISRSGRVFVYTAGTPANSRLVLRRFDSVDGAFVRGGEAAVNPFLSPDEDWIGFLGTPDRMLIKKVAVSGGPTATVAKVPSQVFGAAWLADDSILAGTQSGLWRVPPGGGEPIQVTELDKSRNETGHMWPAEIPGTDAVLFVAAHGMPMTTGKLAAVDLETRQIVRFDIAGVRPRYVHTGHIVFANADGTLRAVEFDRHRLQTAGNPIPVVEGVTVKASGAANFDIAGDGRIVYGAGGPQFAARSITWVDRTGRETPIPAPLRSYFYARVSPTDGARLSLDIRGEGSDIWIWDARGTLTKLTSNDGIDQYGLWMPDGRQVIFASEVAGKLGIFKSRADGIGVPELLVEREIAFPNAVTPDGKSIVFRAGAGNRNDLFVVSTGGDGKAAPLVATQHNEQNAAISPDGRWLAYESDLSGRSEVYVRPFPDVNSGQWTVSTGGGSEPVWARNGREIFYVSLDTKLMAAGFTETPSITLTAPRMLFDASAYFFGGVGRNYDVGRDGRFVMVKNAPDEGLRTRPIHVILNWAEELKAGRPGR
jgi:serine/threonine-protein kinase